MLIVILAVAAAVAAEGGDDAGRVRAGWLLERAAWEDASLTGREPVRDDVLATFRQGEAGAAYEEEGGPGALPIMMSLILPGAGEVYLGHKRGFAFMALDVFLWTRVKSHHDEGHDLREEYLAYADRHWSEDRLDDAFNDIDNPSAPGLEYFPTVTRKEDLPLWVSKEDDFREYYENLGKWDQFVFGWDDFTDPHSIYPDLPEGDIANLRLPGVSDHRSVYRQMRVDANDQFTKRDRILYFNVLLRLASALDVAFLQGLLGGGKNDLNVAGHDVRLIADARGATSARLGLAVSY
jgi:hypothetical protein